MKKFKLLLIGVLMPWCAFAWNSKGHSTAGAIAYYYLLKNNPIVLQKVLTTLKLHYWYNTSHWKSVLAQLPASQQDVGLFMLASTYPDDAKIDPGNMDGDSIHRMWHFIDFPYVVPGSGGTGLPPKTPNAQQKIADFIASIPQEQDSPQRALELAWLFHLVEDVHQPLHCAMMFNKTFPGGDIGGNLIKITPVGLAQNLHAYWDDLVAGSIKTYAAKAQTLLKEAKYQVSQLPELTDTNPNDWMLKESFPDAVSIAYQNDSINWSPSQATTLSASYKKTASALGERRVVLSGIRLAQTLATLYGG